MTTINRSTSITSPMSNMNWKAYRDQVDLNLSRSIQQHTTQSTLQDAIRYSSLNGGKRIRPLLCYAAANDFDLNSTSIDTIAVAVECIHAFSLIHDDLPAMDNDDWRRNQPSCHKQFPEYTAILAGNALQSIAFSSIAQCPVTPPDVQMQCIRILSYCTGAQGLLLGQNYDLSPPNTCDQQTIDRLKTAKLFEACLTMSYTCHTNPCPTVQQGLSRFAESFGLAFQRQDDAMDQEDNLTATQAFSDAYHYLDDLGLNPNNSQLYQLTQYTQARQS